MDIIVVVLMLCGKPDTIILKAPDKPPMFTTDITEQVLRDVDRVFTKDSVLIVHEDKRIKCI